MHNRSLISSGTSARSVVPLPRRYLLLGPAANALMGWASPYLRLLALLRERACINQCTGINPFHLPENLRCVVGQQCTGGSERALGSIWLRCRASVLSCFGLTNVEVARRRRLAEPKRCCPCLTGPMLQDPHAEHVEDEGVFGRAAPSLPAAGLAGLIDGSFVP